jgi:hypothetical protein
MVMATKKVSVTVDAATLDEGRKLAGNDFKLSSFVDDVLRAQVHRFRLLALLDQMDERDPISPEERAEGMRLWQRIEAAAPRTCDRPSR